MSAGATGAGRGPGARRHQRDDRGSVFIQFALLVPVFLVFAMGIIEYGLGWKWANDVNAATRDSARSATSEPAYLTSDRAVLLSIGTSFTTEQVDNIERIVVFNAGGADGKVPNNCKSLTNNTGHAGSAGSRVGVSNSCNVYGKGQIAYVLANPTVDTPWVNLSGKGCDSSDVDSYWCPATRRRSLSTNKFDYVGVYIKVKKPSMTHIGFGEQQVERTSVFRLEPSFGGD